MSHAIDTLKDAEDGDIQLKLTGKQVEQLYGLLHGIGTRNSVEQPELSVLDDLASYLLERSMEQKYQEKEDYSPSLSVEEWNNLTPFTRYLLTGNKFFLNEDSSDGE